MIFIKYSNNFDENMMLSSLGYSTVSCVNLPIELGKLHAVCEYGTIDEILSFGVAKEETDGLSYFNKCLNLKDDLACKPNSAAVKQ